MKVWITECDEWDHAYANKTAKGAINDLVDYLRMELGTDEEYNGENHSVKKETEDAIKEMQEAMDKEATYFSFYTPFGNFYVTRTEVGD